jgi:hypothetical protein
MALSKSQLETTRSEWTDKYFALPANMQPDQLPDVGLSVLPHPTLPAQAQGGGASADVTVDNPSARLENPIMDPTSHI